MLEATNHHNSLLVPGQSPVSTATSSPHPRIQKDDLGYETLTFAGKAAQAAKVGRPLRAAPASHPTPLF